MRNIELKVRLADLDAARAVARELCGDDPSDAMRQIDTYFVVPRGRLKLREIERDAGAAAELIYYERADHSGPKRCDYSIAPVDDAPSLKQTLGAALGVRAVVDKRRTLYLWRNVRIHLDEVEGLGTFLEFEAVMPDNATDADGEALVKELMERFRVSEGDLVDGSYVDAISRQGTAGE